MTNTVSITPSVVTKSPAIFIRTDKVTKPHYDGRCEHFTAAEFQNRFDQYVMIEQRELKDNGRIDLVYECLRGEPKLWFRAFQYQFDSWATFKQSFLKRFWGCPEQRSFMTTMVNGSYVRKGKKSCMSAYFLHFLVNAQYMELPPTEEKLIHLMMHHFPSHVRELLKYSRDMTAVYNTLVMMDRTENTASTPSLNDRAGGGKL